jgi:hypothetical protein
VHRLPPPEKGRTIFPFLKRSSVVPADNTNRAGQLKLKIIKKTATRIGISFRLGLLFFCSNILLCGSRDYPTKDFLKQRSSERDRRREQKSFRQTFSKG